MRQIPCYATNAGEKFSSAKKQATTSDEKEKELNTSTETSRHTFACQVNRSNRKSSKKHNSNQIEQENAIECNAIAMYSISPQFNFIYWFITGYTEL